MKNPYPFLLAVFAILTGCGAVNQANDHLASMDASTKTLTQSVSEDQAYLKNLSAQMELMQKSTERLQLELAADREYLKTLTECMKSLSDSLAAIQKLSDSTVHTILDALLKAKTPDPKTPDAGDLLPPPVSPPSGPVT